jgi:hypothetical protein
VDNLPTCSSSGAARRPIWTLDVTKYMSVRSFLITITSIFAVIGLGRATTEYGYAGLVAYGKLLFGPAIVTLFVVILIPARYGGGWPRNFLPANSTLKRMGVAVTVSTAVGMILSGMFGVGWLVAK